MANNVSLSYPSAFYHQFFDRNGKPLTSGKLYTYIAGSPTPVVTYKTISGGTESANMNTNPIILDMAGMAELVISTDTAYKFVLFDKNNVKIDEWDNVTAGGSGSSGSNVYVEGTNGEIDVEEEREGRIRRFIVSLSDSVKNAISNLSSSVNDIIDALSKKKDKQHPVNKQGSATKVPVSFSQNANGEMNVEFDDIAFPDWTTAINNAVANCENTSNKKNSVTGYESSSTAYPSIKAVVDFVNSIMQNLGGKLITDNGNPFSDSDDLPSTTPYQGVNISDKDYAYVQGTGFAERWSASVSGSSVTWVQEYSINIPVFTPAQQAAIDSGATETKIGNYDSHIANATIHVTAKDKNTWNAKQNSISDLAEIRSGAAAGATALQPNGNGSNVTSTFTTASSRTNISSGEKLSTIFGKIAKWFSDLKALAFKDKVSDSDISGTIANAHIASASTWNGKQNALPTSGSATDTYAVNISGTSRYSENLLPYYVSVNNDNSWFDVGTYKANNSDDMYSGITLAVKFRSVDGRTQSGFVWISVGEWKSSGGYSNDDIVCEYYTLGRRVKEKFDSVKLYVNILGTSVTDGVKIYAYLSRYSYISITPINVNKGTYTSSMTYLNAEPATKKEVTYCNLLRSTYGTSIGSLSTPIYVDEYGVLRPCGTVGFADSAKQLSDYRGTEGQNGYKNIYGGYNGGTGEFVLGISKRESGKSKYTEINADGITSSGIITAGIGFVGNLNGVANKAVSDSDGNNINTTYAKKISGIYNIDTYLTDGNAFHDVNLRKQLGPRYVHTRGFTPLMMFYGIINFVDIEYADGYNYAAVDFELYNTQQSGTYGTLMASIGMVVPKGTSSIVIPLPFAWNNGSFSPTLYGNFAHRITAGSAVCNAYYYSLPV